MGDPSIPPQTSYVDGFNLLNVLVSAQELLGPKIYNQALQQSGLERYKDNLPAPADQQVATGQQVAAFWTAIYRQVNFAVFKLLQRNVGLRIAQLSQGLPESQADREAVLALPRSERLEVAVKSTCEIISRRSLPMRYKAHKNGFLLYFENCPFICHTIKSSEPLCHSYEFTFLKFLQWKTQLPLVSSEISCVAMGDEHCQFYYHEVGLD